MSILSGLLEWTQINLVPFGPAGLFALAFMESSFFPIPPDLLLIPLVLAAPDMWLLFAAITTIGSVLGGIFGYFIGLKGGRPVLHKLAGRKTTEKAEKYFRKYGDWAVGIAGFTPVPYKIFTILAGAMRHNIARFITISVATRGARFFLVAGVIAAFGNSIIASMDTLFIISLPAAAAAFLAWYVLRRRNTNVKEGLNNASA